MCTLLAQEVGCYYQEAPVDVINLKKKILKKKQQQKTTPQKSPHNHFSTFGNVIVEQQG